MSVRPNTTSSTEVNPIHAVDINPLIISEENILFFTSSLSVEHLAQLTEAANKFLGYFNQPPLLDAELTHYHESAEMRHALIGPADPTTYINLSLEALFIDENIASTGNGFGSKECDKTREILSNERKEGPTNREFLVGLLVNSLP